jgi:hypothetical protein
MHQTICHACGRLAHGVLRDVGPECGGRQWVSECCAANVVEGGCKVIRRGVHRAHKEFPGQGICRGDLYSETVFRSYRCRTKSGGGESWIHVKRVKIAL